MVLTDNPWIESMFIDNRSTQQKRLERDGAFLRIMLSGERLKVVMLSRSLAAERKPVFQGTINPENRESNSKFTKVCGKQNQDYEDTS